MRDIEIHLGATLFERTLAGIRPTTIGREFLDIARRIVDETDTAFVRLKARCGGESGPLAIGIYAALSAGNLRATIMEHHRRHPSVELRAVDGPRHHLLSELAAGVIDMAIVTADESLWAERKLPLWTERVVVALDRLIESGRSRSRSHLGGGRGDRGGLYRRDLSGNPRP